MRIVLLLLLCFLTMEAQERKAVRGTAHWAVQKGTDLGAVPDEQLIEGITVHLRLSADKQQALEELIARQAVPGSADYQRWLTPEQFAARFAPDASVRETVAQWVEASGMKVRLRARGGLWLMAEGKAGQVGRAFGTRLRRYRVDGQEHFANATDLQLPAEVVDLVSSVEGLHDFVPTGDAKVRPIPERTSATGVHSLAPDDLATIYNIAPLLNSGTDGTGQKVAIVGQSLIDVSDYQGWRRRFNLAANDPVQIQVPGTTRPGINSSTLEANLDLQWVSAVARNATIYFVYSQSAFTSLRYVVDQNLAPVVSASYSLGCEARVFASIESYRTTAQQAVAQGITWVNSSGDAGPAACDPNGSDLAQNGYSVRIPASIPEVTSVGGTQFNEGTGTYWRDTNDVNGASVLSYIPELPWNESSEGLLAGGGGRSTFFPKPAWQAGLGDAVNPYRMVPDVAFTAAGHDGYFVTSGGLNYIVSGTSASAPVFAGLLTLLNQSLSGRGQRTTSGLGNVNPRLYRLAATNPEVFHDVVDGNTVVPCLAGSPSCINGGFGHAAGPGYDMATGLGSVDASLFVRNFSAEPAVDSLVTLSIGPNPVYATTNAAGVNSWSYTINLAELAGVGTTITDLLINGTSQKANLVTFFGNVTIPALGTANAPLVSSGLNVPVTRTFELRGQDASGKVWSRTFDLQFLAAQPTPTIAGVANGASFKTAFAPGMVLSVFGTNLAGGAQAAGAVPLLTWTNQVSATVNGVSAPIYYISPGQLNLQIPYETAAGTARLIVTNGTKSSATFTFPVAAVAPGIFVGANGATVPFGSGKAGQTLILFVTGAGTHTPAIATGAAPAPTSTVAQLPKPAQALTMTIGGVNAPVVFAGIPAGLVGVTQVNFTVPAGVAAGVQPLVVKVGGVESAPASFTVLP